MIDAILEKDVQDLAVRAVEEEALLSARNDKGARVFRDALVRNVASLDVESISRDLLVVMNAYVSRKPAQSTAGKVITLIESLGVPLFAGAYVAQMHQTGGNHLYNFSVLAATLLGLGAQSFVNKHYREHDAATLDKLAKALADIPEERKNGVVFRMVAPVMSQIEEQYAPYGVSFR